MCSPAIVFIISKISHVFSWYRSKAGRHIKNRPHTLQCFADFLQNEFGRFSRLAVLSPPPIPHPVHYTTCFADSCSSGLVSQTQKGDRKGVELNMMPPQFVQNPQKIDNKISKNYPRLLIYTPGIEKKLYMCLPAIEFLTPVAT
jgi:hypothetical protein